MRRILLSTIAVLALASPAIAAETERAITLRLGANNVVQAAIATDVCREFDLSDHTELRDGLSIVDRASYDAIREALRGAYIANAGTDGALEAVDADFCKAVSDR